jgi:hypothetical protein
MSDHHRTADTELLAEFDDPGAVPVPGHEAVHQGLAQQDWRFRD